MLILVELLAFFVLLNFDVAGLQLATVNSALNTAFITISSKYVRPHSSGDPLYSSSRSVNTFCRLHSVL